jgi:EAL domain-containing protein (putative c-di-GMP-specific phosphodiesterase class I)
VQGFLFSQPLDIDAAAALVSGDASEVPALPLAEAS